MNLRRLLLGLVVISRAITGAVALETDQFYSWNRPLQDATDAINAEVNAGIDAVLTRANARRRSCACEDILKAIDDQFDYAVISRLELWVMNTPAVERAPAGAGEEAAYKRGWLYGESPPLDPINWMPPSPTIEVAGVRIGIDKLGHFFSDGEWAHRWYRHALKHGATDEKAVARAMRDSFLPERTIWGQGTSGILSLADLEADYQGLNFYRGLCSGANPMLERTSGGWRMRAPFDLRDWVSPAWDESWRPCVYAPSRWAKVKPVMRRYCGLLRDPEVQNRRAAYAARDKETAMAKFVHELVASGKLADPKQFTIDAVCGAPPDP